MTPASIMKIPRTPPVNITMPLAVVFWPLMVCQMALLVVVRPDFLWEAVG